MNSKLYATGEICLIKVNDPDEVSRVKSIGLGNYYKTNDGKTILVTTIELAQKYGHLVDVPVYVRRPKQIRTPQGDSK